MYHDTELVGAVNTASPAPWAGAKPGWLPMPDFGVSDVTGPSNRILAPRGTWYDDGIDFRQPIGDRFTEYVLILLADLENRQKKRRPNDQANFHNLIRKIIANGFRCQYFRSAPFVAVQLKGAVRNGGHKGPSGKAMARALDLLMKAGLVEVLTGEKSVSSSLYRITDKLVDIAQGPRITEKSIVHTLPSDRLVRLREGNRNTDNVSFEPTDETTIWMDQLDAYNRFIAQQDIGIILSDDETR